MKVGRNELCPCGSGRKFKKCCQANLPARPYTRADRDSATSKLDDFIGRDPELAHEDDAAFDELWGRWADHPDDLGDGFDQMSEQVYDLWFAFDRPLANGQLVVDRLLEARARQLGEGEQRYLRAVRASSMRLYEVEDSRPGESLSLRDVVEGDRVTVQERAGSRSIHRFEWLAARVVAGASGKPELEGVLGIPPAFRRQTQEQLRAGRDRFLAAHPGAPVETFYKTMAPAFHQLWAGAILEPHVPQLANTDGDELVITYVHFDVIDAGAARDALDRAAGLRREAHERDLWHWSGPNDAKGEATSLGLLTLREQTLTLEANSVARGTRGRALVERAAAGAVRHRVTTHEDLRRQLVESLKRREPGPPAPDDGIPPETQEALVLAFSARHYRKWLDEPVPALDGRTPRDAARDAALRPRLVELLRELEELYQRALAATAPAFDASWLWAELGLEDEPAPHPPPLAAERLDQLVSGSAACCRAVAERLRKAPGFDDASTAASDEALRDDLELRRFLAANRPAATPERPELVAEAQPRGAGSNQALAQHLALTVNFELHRRKAFWVDEGLAYLLARTELDVRGDELRVPFPSFALVFTDRHVLSLGERVLARRRDSPLAGHLLRVATVFVTEHRHGDERALHLTFAFDALGADLPALVALELPVKAAQPVEAFLDTLGPTPQTEPSVPDANPLRALVQVSVNAVLYATSAGVEALPRPAPQREATGAGRRGGPPLGYSSDQVFWLPGPIEISQVRRLQQLERVPDGRTVLRRFMVRGHWRRPAAGWADRRMRWVQPYWKGPDLATVIERTYKLTP